ncbi:MAG: hypothetical protein AAGF15_06725 [Pseudomonadota bacterium]
MEELREKSVREMLAIHAAAMSELRDRNVLRSENQPTGDLAEHLFCKAFGWVQAKNSVKSYDAKDRAGVRYQIKGRRLKQAGQERQLSAIRDLNGFDVLAVVIFNRDFGIQKAALLPSEMVRQHARFNQHTNSYRFMATDQILNASGATDATDALVEALGI